EPRPPPWSRRGLGFGGGLRLRLEAGVEAVDENVGQGQSREGGDDLEKQGGDGTELEEGQEGGDERDGHGQDEDEEQETPIAAGDAPEAAKGEAAGVAQGGDGAQVGGDGDDER